MRKKAEETTVIKTRKTNPRKSGTVKLAENKSDDRLKSRLKLELVELMEIVRQDAALNFLENSLKGKEENLDAPALLSYYRIVSQTLLEELKKKSAQTQLVVPPVKIMISESETNQLRKEAQEKTKIANEYAVLLEKIKADFEAFRQRVNKQQQTLEESANEKLILKLLPILDGFAYALSHPVDDGNYRNFVSGIRMIYSQAEDLFKSEGIVPIKVDPGEKFDPHSHEAVMEVKGEEGQEGLVKEEIQRGYCFRNKVLRPAKVKVTIV